MKTNYHLLTFFRKFIILINKRGRPQFQAIIPIRALLLLLMLPGQWLAAQQADRPNIVWLVSEDNSRNFLQLYDPSGAPMPNVEALARHGLVFNQAFSQAPVCSVARSTLISGCYAPRIGAQYHRATERPPMPAGLQMFPYYLRQAGYYTSNNAKEDYNLAKSEGMWDDSSNRASYRNRKAGQPFFHVQNYGTTHESQLHFTMPEMTTEKNQTDPAAVTPFPYHPDTETFRYTYARYHDLHRKVDAQLGEFISQLEADGLMDDTFIFYYGDHGGVLPRSKGYIYESGLQVPLVVYVPEKWKHLVPAAPGSRLDGFVQFSDFGPTVLHLAGIDVPEQMDGKPFLGKGITQEELQGRQVSFSYADRFDEKYDLVRGVRKGRYKYLRNYQPFNPDGLYNFYRYRMLAYQEWQELYDQGKLNAVQSQFFQPRAAEALYDLDNDPHETHNLAADPDLQNTLLEMRTLLQTHLRNMADLSFYPEPYLLDHAMKDPAQFGRDHREEISRLMDIADLSLVPFAKAKKGIKAALRSQNALDRYWALIVCSTFGKQAAAFYKTAHLLAAGDADRLVRVRAAEFLALTDQQDPGPVLLSALRQSSSTTEVNLQLNTAAMLQQIKNYQLEIPAWDIRPEWLSMPGALAAWRMDYLGRGQRPRLLVLTDIGGDPDDTQSMIRLLVHADEFEIEGLIASASGTPGELKQAIVQPALIREVVQAYGKVEGRLKQHSPYFPQAHQLLNLIRSGNPQRGWEAVGAGHDTEGSEWIIRQADKVDTRPLNIAVWGGQTDLAQALWKVKNTRTEAEYRHFISKLRIYDIADQDGIFARIQSSFPGLWYILNKAPEGQDRREAVFRGMYLDGELELTSLDWLKKNIIEAHGPLGALYPQKTWTAPNPYQAMKEGDTPSWFYFLPNGLNDPSHPEYGGWGGRFQRNAGGYYVDAADQMDTVLSARVSVARWRPDFQNDFAARIAWTTEAFSGANHHPIRKGTLPQPLTAKASSSITLAAPEYLDPDGDQLQYFWTLYPEAGAYRASAPQLLAQEQSAVLSIPADAAGQEIHVILRVQDSGSPSLTAYSRFLVRVR